LPAGDRPGREEVRVKGLLLLAFGGPRNLDEVEPFLGRLFRGRTPSSEQVERVKERYRLIGGGSPLPAITGDQARALERRLNEGGGSFKGYVGMRYGHPLVEEALAEMARDGIAEGVAVAMAPFRSPASTGAYAEELSRAGESMGPSPKVALAGDWHGHPLFLEAVAERVREGLASFLPEKREKVHLLFTAHSLPEAMVRGTPYERDFTSAVEGVLRRLGPRPWSMAYQSRGGGADPWLGPHAESVLEELASGGAREVLVVPIGFVADHIEVLYDVDVLFAKKALDLGMTLRRSPSLNVTEKFIEALAAVVRETAAKDG
jgi:protoporphyrin/coproporphyrin ferrochelatase